MFYLIIRPLFQLNDRILFHYNLVNCTKNIVQKILSCLD